MDRHGFGDAPGRQHLKQAIETRELIAMSIDGVCVRGTYHRPQQENSENSRTGVLFLNPGFLPRAGIGDSAVGYADAFAKTGYPCFRIDVTGLGDAEGESPQDLIEV